ncbi:putative nuclease HARBI1 [Saccostrea cucullata]|uniref:putative nuclease HARBI1 n=1 Tax=Saccostrea cuccullata TaxID=36930 RepID=UPI002ED27D6D
MAFQIMFQRSVSIRKDRVFRDRSHPLDIYDDTELIRRYRMPRWCILELIDTLSNDLEPPTMRSHSIPASLQVIGDISGISQPSVSRIVKKTSKILAQKVGNYIKFPATPTEQLTVKQGFSTEFNMPNTLGCVDGTLIAIKPPSEREDAYVCRKGYHAINVQRGQPYVGHLLGDQAYALRQYLLTPLRNPQTQADRAFNVAHKKARQRIEDTFGRWKSRWLCIHKYGGPLTVALQTAVDVITSTAVLHNLCEKQGFPVEMQQDNDDNDTDERVDNDVQDRSGQQMRAMIIRDRF